MKVPRISPICIFVYSPVEGQAKSYKPGSHYDPQSGLTRKSRSLKAPRGTIRVAVGDPDPGHGNFTASAITQEVRL